MVVDGLFAFGALAEREDQSRGLASFPEVEPGASAAALMMSNAAVSYGETCFAYDASLAKGAVVEAWIGSDLCEKVCLSSDKKGHYVTLDSGARKILRHLGEEHEEPLPPMRLRRPKASPLLYFDFVEICGGVLVQFQRRPLTSP